MTNDNNNNDNNNNVPNNNNNLDTIRQRYEAAGQGHVLKYYDTIPTDDEKEKFRNQLANSIPVVDHLKEYLEKAQSSSKIVATTSSSSDGCTIKPFTGPVVSLDDTTTAEEKDNWRKVGLEAIRKGHIAALVLAGGQGTRLGFDGPKGCYNIGLPSKKTLFQLLTERLERLQVLAAGGGGNNDDAGDGGSKQQQLSLYVMTSPLNHDETVSFFEQHNTFNCKSVQVYFFPQGMLPCLDSSNDQNGGSNTNKILLEGPGKIAMAPDGNGGIYTALEKSGMLQQMEEQGVKYIHAFSIDNALCRPADPVFMGYCISQKADCGNKVVWKSEAHEKVGVLAQDNDGKPCIVEYSDLSKEMAEATTTTDDDGKLVFGAANICNHFYTLDFIKDEVLPNMANLYHVAHKKIPYYNGSTITTPTTPNGIKLESFIFDVFPLSKSMTVMNVKREDEFAPVKNAPQAAGASSSVSTVDSPDTARQMVSELSQRLLIQAGAKLQNKPNSDDDEDGSSMICEISPLTSYAGEGLEKEYNGRKVKCPFII